jgi:hypothetical protein
MNYLIGIPTTPLSSRVTDNSLAAPRLGGVLHEYNHAS